MSKFNTTKIGGVDIDVKNLFSNSGTVQDSSFKLTQQTTTTNLIDKFVSTTDANKRNPTLCGYKQQTNDITTLYEAPSVVISQSTQTAQTAPIATYPVYNSFYVQYTIIGGGGGGGENGYSSRQDWGNNSTGGGGGGSGCNLTGGLLMQNPSQNYTSAKIIVGNGGVGGITQQQGAIYASQSTSGSSGTKLTDNAIGGIGGGVLCRNVLYTRQRNGDAGGGGETAGLVTDSSGSGGSGGSPSALIFKNSAGTDIPIIIAGGGGGGGGSTSSKQQNNFTDFAFSGGSGSSYIISGTQQIQNQSTTNSGQTQGPYTDAFISSMQCYNYVPSTDPNNSVYYNNYTQYTFQQTNYGGQNGSQYGNGGNGGLFSDQGTTNGKRGSPGQNGQNGYASVTIWKRY